MDEEFEQVVAFVCELAATGSDVNLSGGLAELRVDIGKINAYKLRKFALRNFRETENDRKEMR